MTDWVYVPQTVWSLYVMIDNVRLGKIGPVGLLVYVSIFVLLLLGTRWRCRREEERGAREERRQREREERLEALPPWGRQS